MYSLLIVFRLSFSLRTEYKKYPLYDTNAKCIVAPFSNYDTTFHMSYMKNIQISIDREEDFNDQSGSLKSFNTITYALLIISHVAQIMKLVSDFTFNICIPLHF